MKNKIYLIACLFMALPMLTLQSCSDDDEISVADKTNNRVQNYLINAKEILTSAENGWALSYVPHRQLKYGGINYALKFETDNSVTVWYEERPGQTRKSTFNMTSDDGPVLSFDTYNEFMHYYAKPSQGEYEAKDGDFEFILLKVTADSITLKGKRSGNIMYMSRLTVSPAEYMQSIEDLKAVDHHFGGGTTVIDGVNYSAIFDMRNRKLMLSDEQSNEVGNRTFMFTQTGIQLVDTMMVGDVVLKDFRFVEADSTFVCDNVVFNLVSTYKKYEEFLGSYTIKELDGRTVTLSVDKNGESYKVEGLTYVGTAIAKYDTYWGSITFGPQLLDSWSNSSYPSINDWLVLTDGDMIYWGEEYMATTAVAPVSPLTFTFGSNGMTILEYAFTKADLNEEGNEALGTVEEYPQTMIWVKQE